MKIKTILITSLLLTSSLCAHAKTLTIGIDLSGSNPLLSHENFAYSASRYIGREIVKLKTGDSVQIKTFGARGEAQNLINQQLTISRRLKPAKVAQLVENYIRSLPGQKDIQQSATNLIAWLEFTNGFACKASSNILVITDGLESSSYVSGKALLAGKKKLPTPDVDLSGCTLTFYGLGAGWSAQHVKRIRNVWRDWAKQAGASFNAIIP